MRQAALVTFGCQMNKSDSEEMKGILVENSYRITEDLSAADVILLNTCSIREKAEKKVYSYIGTLKPLKAKRPKLIIGVGGCVGQLKGEDILKKSPLVNFVFGTSAIHKLPLLLKNIEKTGKRLVEVNSPSAWKASGYSERSPLAVSAWVNIMKGCSNFCTYCVVPYARGREKSRPEAEIIAEVTGIAADGIKEVTLLGQNVNSYGSDNGLSKGLPELLEAVNGVFGIERVRFVTSHPKDFSEALVMKMAKLDKVCESIHLPLQSGSDIVLEKMNRGYSVSKYKKALGFARANIKNLSVTTDIIVGFPGETEDDFQGTVDVIENVRYDSMFLFKYSMRPETPAASMEGQVPEEVKQRRFQIILEKQKKITSAKNCEYEGRSVEVLVEGRSRKDPDKFTGRTRTNKVVNFSCKSELPAAKLVNVHIVKGRYYGLEGYYEG